VATVGSILVNTGKQIIINRAYTASPAHLIPTQFKVGIDSDAPNIGDIDLDNPVPISDGRVLDGGDVNMTGKFGAGTSVSGTSIFKEGGGTTDATSQSLIADNVNSGTRSWDIQNLSGSASGTAEAAFWLNIANQKTLDAFASSGTVLQARLGSGTQTNYFYWERTKSQLKTGWNWIRSGTQINQLGMSGSVNGSVSSFTLQLVTAGTADQFDSGSVRYDLLRQWQASDLLKDWVSGTYPDVNESLFIAEMRGELTTTEANGFDIDSFGNFNKDSPIKMSGEDVFASESKSSTDKFVFVIQDRLN